MSLDVPERQVLLYDEDDENPWQHRLLIRRLGVGAARWIVITPDHAVEAVDLSTATVRALPRNTVLPEDCVEEGCYAFDPISGPDMLRLRAESDALADVLGAPLVDPNVPEGHGTAIWLVSDTGNKLFNKEVPTSVTGSVATFTFRQHVGIACIEGDWMSCEFVEPDDRSEWLDAKRAGAGRDPRLIEAQRELGTGMRTTLREACPTYAKAPREGWPFKGPDAVVELLHGILATGLEPQGFISQWKQSSGVSPQSGVAIEFGVHLTTLNHMISFDQINLYHSAAAEMISRRLLMIMRAVRRSPRAPDFEGLDMFLSNSTDTSGAVVTLDFDKYVADVQKADAAIMKQSRMMKEEHEAAAKKKKDGKPSAAP